MQRLLSTWQTYPLFQPSHLVLLEPPTTEPHQKPKSKKASPVIRKDQLSRVRPGHKVRVNQGPRGATQHTPLSTSHTRCRYAGLVSEHLHPCLPIPWCLCQCFQPASPLSSPHVENVWSAELRKQRLFCEAPSALPKSNLSTLWSPTVPLPKISAITSEYVLDIWVFVTWGFLDTVEL